MHDASVREEYRWLLKDYGTLMRKFDQDIWVKRAMSRMPLFHLNLPVVTDVRYENEARITKENGFLLVRLDVEPETIVARGGSVSDHASETELDSYPDFVLRYQSEMFTPEEIARLIIDEIDRS